MSELVWDSSALLAVLNREPGWENLAENLSEGAISAVNLAEVVGKLAERGMPREEILEVLAALLLEVHSFDADDAVLTGLLRPGTRDLGLSLGDRSCLALGSRLGRPVVTTDRAWAEVEEEEEGIEVRLAR